ncbi:response regulator transcription factor [Amycolatopsis rubida]|uniref:Response regulator transcription factor n=1 Tax=Amycolatopsis rubida TaxID=112413 RepID=A0ABX0BXG0_9PSEU|nr:MULTISPECIES: response regulator transcription factor [Amycolatopsis]MYW94161.1 response regulator [Amycolatopsis rubida]NEC59150.1 response regulator transcription factor [Amycolatopsis rubida]OAP20924.1 Transcriptional regulatory protein DevR (DosR) [Amycolatopsis sp. M39]
MIRVLVAEDMHVVRGALVALLGLEKDIEVVGDCADGAEILPLAASTAPEVAVIDIDLPGKDGLTAAAELHERLPGTRTLILTGLGSPGTLRRALAAKVGGFFLKDAPADRLADAVRGVAAGRRMVDADLALAAWEGDGSPLTVREAQVLRMAADGSQPDEIAARLCLSAGTVRNYLTTIVVKTGARNRVDAVRIARESGWI